MDLRRLRSHKIFAGALAGACIVFLIFPEMALAFTRVFSVSVMLVPALKEAAEVTGVELPTVTVVEAESASTIEYANNPEPRRITAGTRRYAGMVMARVRFI